MATSAKRLGLDVSKDNLELELRLRRIETALESSSESDAQRVTTIPQVSGLSLTGSIPGAISVAWTSVRISDLRRYELDVAENLGFSVNNQSFTTAGTEFTYTTNEETGGGGDTTVYVRVRARGVNGNVGPYSAVLNTTTGQAQAADIADEAVTTEAIAEGAVTVAVIEDGTITSVKIEDGTLQFVDLDDSDVGSKLALRGFISGLILSNDVGDTTNDINITAGVARNTGNTSSMPLISEITKRIDESWTLGDDGGGFPDTALTLTNDTWYRVFLIQQVNNGTVDAGFDTSATAVNLIAEAVLINSGWTGAVYRQIGWVRRLTSANKEFYQSVNKPEHIRWNSPVLDTDTTNWSSGHTTRDATVPPGAFAIMNHWVRWSGGNGDIAYFIISSLDSTAVTPSSSILTLAVNRENNSSVHISGNVRVEVEVNSSSQYRWSSSNTDSAGSPQLEISTLGYHYYRGQHE